MRRTRPTRQASFVGLRVGQPMAAIKRKKKNKKKTWIIKALPAFGIFNKKLSKTSFDIFQFSSIKTIGGDLKTTNKKQA
jgi:hypothetical protein